MAQYIIRRILWMIPVLLLISAITFIFMHLIPGGPFDAVEEKPLPPQIRTNLRTKFHLDEPVWKQYLRFMLGDFVDSGNPLHICGHKPEDSAGAGGVLCGDLGPSYTQRGKSINDMLFSGGLKAKVMVSAQLGLVAVLIGLGIGVPLGVISALKQNTMTDYVSMFLAMLGVSIPNFVLGLMLMLAVLWLNKHNLNVLGLPIARWQSWKHAILPAITLGSSGTALLARLTRASMLDVIRQDYVRTARAKGLREWAVIVGHALKNSLIPVVTVLGPLAAAWLTGSFLVEQVFAVPGIGQYFVDGITNRDYTLITGTILFYAVILVFMNLIVDISYAFLDPRIRFTD